MRNSLGNGHSETSTVATEWACEHGGRCRFSGACGVRGMRELYRGARLREGSEWGRSFKRGRAHGEVVGRRVMWAPCVIERKGKGSGGVDGPNSA